MKRWLLILVCLFLAVHEAGATGGFIVVQIKATGAIAPPATTQALNAFTSSLTAGNAVVLTVTNSATQVATCVTGITDGQGNTWTQDKNCGDATHRKVELWHTANVVGGTTDIITLTIASACTTGKSLQASAVEFSGVATTSSFDTGSCNTGSSTTPSITGYSTGNARELTVSAVDTAGGVGAGPIDWRILAAAGTPAIETVYQLNKATSASIAGTWIAGTTGAWTNATGSYKNNATTPPIEWIQDGGTTSDTCSTTSMALPTITTTAGDTLVVLCSGNAAGGNDVFVVYVTDDVGDFFSPVTWFGTGATGYVFETHTSINFGGATTATAHWSLPNNNCNNACSISEYAGLGTGIQIDKTATNSGTSTTASSGNTGATAHADELLVGVLGVTGNVTRGGASGNANWAPLTDSTGTTNQTTFPFYNIQTATGAQGISNAISASSAFKGEIVTLFSGSTPVATPTFTPTQTATATQTFTPTSTATFTFTPTATPAPTATATFTAVPTSTATASTPTATPKPTPACEPQVNNSP